MDDCIVISDDEEVEYLEHVVNLEPILIDLTRVDETPPSKPQSNHASKTPSTQASSHSPEPASAFQPPPASQPPPTPASQPPPTPIPQAQPPPAPRPSQPPEQVPRASQASKPSQPTQPSFRSTFTTSSDDVPTAPPMPKTTPAPAWIPQPMPEPAPTTTATPTVPTTPTATTVPTATTAPAPPAPQNGPKMSDHDFMLAQKALGNEKYKNNLFDDAIRIYRRASDLATKLKNHEMSSILHFNLAMTYCKVGSLDQAADECAQAVKLNDKYIKAHLKRAEIYQRQRKYEEAVICYEHICELDSNNSDYLKLLNFAKEAAKRTKKKDYYQILGLNPNFTVEDLKKAYRQKALTHHPDRHSDADIVTRRIQEKYFKDASEAHGYVKLKLGFIG